MLVVFFKQKTAYEVLISDWSSDLCSSDLMVCAAAPIIRTAGDAARLFRARLCRRERETLIVAHLDAKRRLIRLSEETVGATGRVVLPVRAIVADALRLDSAGLILAHCHPAAIPNRAPRTSRRREG